MILDMGLLLRTAQEALLNGQTQYGQDLLDYAIDYARDDFPICTLSSLDTAIGLDRGKVRAHNEDCVFALQGLLPQTRDAFGFYVLCDGMGGHAGGLDASHLAVETMMWYVLPRLIHAPSAAWEQVLLEGVHTANHAIYERNHATWAERCPVMGHNGAEQLVTTDMMGTTITAALLIGDVAYVVNVGDSRTYVSHPHTGLVRVTNDHSTVAELFRLADSPVTPEEMYTHPQRNLITRSLGHDLSVKADTFVVPLRERSVLLLCSDGLWEMTRDTILAELLAYEWASSDYIARQLVHLALRGGGHDNIGLIVARTHQHQQCEEHWVTTTTQPLPAERHEAVLAPESV